MTMIHLVAYLTHRDEETHNILEHTVTASGEKYICILLCYHLKLLDDEKPGNVFVYSTEKKVDHVLYSSNKRDSR